MKCVSHYVMMCLHDFLCELLAVASETEKAAVQLQLNNAHVNGTASVKGVLGLKPVDYADCSSTVYCCL